jgi:uncharacterized protein YegP (UPF0339 family)
MKFRIYKDTKGEYRWTLIASNGRKIADSGEGYTSKSNCEAAITSIKSGASSATVEDGTASQNSRY